MDARNKFSSIYDAHPLDAGPSTNIRVIKVLRNASTDTDVPIACELQVVSLEYSPVYTCLSYVWGQDAASKEILLDGKPFKIRENLWNLLMQYRSTTSSDDCIWVDALSIDQGRVGERNHQVALMKRIYSEARMVISWLGSGPNSPARALQELAEPWDNNWLSYLTNLVTLCQSEYWDRLWMYVLLSEVTFRLWPILTNCHVSASRSSFSLERWRFGPVLPESKLKLLRRCY